MRFTINHSKTGNLLLWLIFSCLGNLHSQTGEYYRKIHLAENKVIVEKYDEAIPLYTDAFLWIESPFLKDLHNALLCAVKYDDKISAKVFIDEIVKYDVDTHFYYKSDKLKELHADKELYHYFKSQLNAKHSSPNTACSFYTKLLALDQSIRTTCKEINTNYYAICGEEIKLLDSVNLEKLENFFLSYGVPGDINLCKTNPSRSPEYYLIIEHNLQWGRNNLESLLIEAVESYKIHPLLFSKSRDYFNESYLKQPAWYGLGYTIKVADRLFVFDVPTKSKDSINAHRKAIHLEPIDEYNSKVIFQYHHPEFCLIYPGLFFSFDAGPDMEKELAEKWSDFEVFKK